MRKLTTREDRREAQYLRDALVGGEVPASLKLDGDGGFAVWVHEDDDMDYAAELLHAFALDPNDARIRELAVRAAAVRTLVSAEQRAYDRQMEVARRAQSAAMRPRTTSSTVTVGLIAASGILAYFTNLGHQNTELFGFRWDAVLAGEWWRLILPIFVHLNLIHLVFNVLWVWSLGRAVETHYGSHYLLAQTLVFGVGGVLAEGFITSSPAMGLSGVVYGLLGFLWVRGRLDRTAHGTLPPSLVVMMLFWMLLGFMRVIDNIANWAHAGGLVLGMLWGAVSAGVSRLRRA